MAGLAQGAQGLLSSALTQGITVATGLQPKFDWAGVAASAIGQGLSSQITTGGTGGEFLRAGADGIASAATRSALAGTNFGDNIIAVLPGVIARTLGGMMNNAIERAQYRNGPGVDNVAAVGAQLVSRLADQSMVAPIDSGISRAHAGLNADIQIQNRQHAIDAANADDGPEIVVTAPRDPSFEGVTLRESSSLTMMQFLWNTKMPARQRLGQIMTNHLRYPAGTEYSLSHRLLTEGARDPIRFDRTVSLLDAELKGVEFAAAFEPDMALLRAAQAQMNSTFEANWSNSLIAFRDAYLNVGRTVFAPVDFAMTIREAASGELTPAEAAIVVASLGMARRIKAAKGPLDSFGGVKPAPGTRVRPEGIPDGWRIRPTREPGGTWYYDPKNKGNAVRVMQGQPGSPHPSSQNPYVRWQKNGAALDMNGNVVPKNTPDAHIPLGTFKFDPKVFK